MKSAQHHPLCTFPAATAAQFIGSIDRSRSNFRQLREGDGKKLDVGDESTVLKRGGKIRVRVKCSISLISVITESTEHFSSKGHPAGILKRSLVSYFFFFFFPSPPLLFSFLPLPPSEFQLFKGSQLRCSLVSSGT